MKTFIIRIYLVLIHTIMILISHCIPINKKKIVFSSFGGKQYSDNPRYISEILHAENPETTIIWIFCKPEEKKKNIPVYVRCIRKGSFLEYYHLATAKLWVMNTNIPKFFYKSKRQVYIQTWHGDRGFKNILYDKKSSHNKQNYLPGDLIEEKYCDMMISASEYGKKRLRSAFHYDGPFIEKGLPRNDQLINSDVKRINEVKASIGIPIDKKVFFYAPTFRSSDISQHKLQDISGINFVGILDELEIKYNNKWICMIRAHSAVGGFLMNDESARVIDVTQYDDMNALLLITDFFVTDYSSSAGDYILKKKPLVLYQADRELYTKEDRDFSFDITMSPFIIAKSMDELLGIVSNFDDKSIENNYQALVEFFGIYETGNAGQAIVEYILDHMK